MIVISVDAHFNQSLINISIRALSFSTYGIYERCSVSSFILIHFDAQVSLRFSSCRCFLITSYSEDRKKTWEWSQLGLGLLEPPVPGADLRPCQRGSTVRASHRHPAGRNPAQREAYRVINYTGLSHSAWWNMTLWDNPVDWSTPSVNKWPVNAPGKIITHSSKHTGIFVPEVKGAKFSTDEASWGIFSRGALTAMPVSGNGFLCRELPETLSLLFGVVFLVNQLSHRKHYTNMTNPRYSTTKLLKSLTQTVSPSIWPAE